MDSKYLLEIKSLSLKINNRFINDDISFMIEPGDLVSIIGPNGSGKSTLVKLISGDLKPTSGSIFFLNKLMEIWDTNDLAKKRAVLSQSTEISFPFSVFDIITMGRFPYNREGKLNSRELDYCFSIIDKFDLTNLVYRTFTTLSGGEKQRVQLARIFIQIWNDDSYEKKLLILDEPTNNLDIKHQLALFDLIEELNKEGLSIIVVLHDLNHAIFYSKKTIMLKKGRLEHFGHTVDVFNENNLKNIFDVNLTVHSVSNNHSAIVLKNRRYNFEV